MRVFLLLVLVVAGVYLVAPPFSLPENGVLVVIEQGASVSQVAGSLKRSGVIRSELAFNALARARGVSAELKAGRYKFSEPDFLWNVQNKIVKGEYGTTVEKFTIPEGKKNDEISRLIGVELGKQDQGYLFPDTYYIDEYASREEIISLMRANFDTKVGTSTASSTIIIASILEEEVRGEEDMRIVAGILEKRLKAGMLLQVDAYPDSYKVAGLPAEPITNPGLEAIRAAEHPTITKYLYYMSGKDGKTHYAKTLAEHNLNIAKYLK